MSASPRRTPYTNARGVREPGIYTLETARDGVVFEIGWRDTQGKQRWRRRVDQTGPLLKTITAARAELAKVQAAKGRGERVTVNPRLTFNEAANAYWEARATRSRPGTQDIYERHLRIHVRPVFGHRRMSDITPDDVARFVATQEAAGLAGWTIKGQLGVIGRVFKYAIRHMGVHVENPVALLERGERPKVDDEEHRILTPDERRRLLEAVGDEFRIIFVFAAETGARLSETLGVVWSDLDLSDAPTATFTHQLDRKGNRVPLKTKRSRRVLEITPGLAAKLRAHRIASAHSGPHDFVFANREGAGYDQRNIGGRVLARAVKAAGLEAVMRGDAVVLPAPTFHDLRHTHASELIAAGWDIEEVSRRLGHADVATTMRIYTHEFDAANRSESRRNRLAALYGTEANAEAQGSEGQAKSGGAETSRVVSIDAVKPKRARKA
jgi:integrase